MACTFQGTDGHYTKVSRHNADIKGNTVNISEHYKDFDKARSDNGTLITDKITSYIAVYNFDKRKVVAKQIDDWVNFVCLDSVKCIYRQDVTLFEDQVPLEVCNREVAGIAVKAFNRLRLGGN